MTLSVQFGVQNHVKKHNKRLNILDLNSLNNEIKIL